MASSSANGARESAAAFRELLGAQDAAARKAELLRGQIDPLYAAQQRYNGAVSIAADLLRRGAISETEHTAALKLATSALKDAEHAQRGHGEAAGLNRMQMMELTHAARASFDAIAAGANPMRVVAMEGGRVAQAARLRRRWRFRRPFGCSSPTEPCDSRPGGHRRGPGTRRQDGARL